MTRSASHLRWLTAFVFLTTAFLVPTLSDGQEMMQVQIDPLAFGDPAPRLSQGAYLRGEPVTAFESGKVYVIDFWATWCPACIQLMPHVSALQAKYGDDVVFIGQNVQEDDDAAVAKFVESMGDKINYRIALDDRSLFIGGSMSARYLGGMGLGALPAAMIIDGEGRIAWFGLAAMMDTPLRQIVAGTYDIEWARRVNEQEPAYMAFLQDKILPLWYSGDLEEALEALGGGVDQFPDLPGRVGMLQAEMLMNLNRPAQALATIKQTLPKLGREPAQANLAARLIMTAALLEGHRDLALAQQAAELAVASTDRQDPVYLDTLATVYWENGMAEQAKKAIKDAIAASSNASISEQLTDKLARFTAAG